MTQVLVEASMCLDGSMAGYYYSPPPAGHEDSDLWVLYLQGGGACYDQPSCAARAKTTLGSSKAWPAAFAGDDEPAAAVSSDPRRNPDFYSGHRVVRALRALRACTRARLRGLRDALGRRVDEVGRA